MVLRFETGRDRNAAGRSLASAGECFYATLLQRYGFISGLEASVAQGTLESGHEPNPCFQAHQRAFGRIVSTSWRN